MRCDISREPGFVLGRHNDVKKDAKDIVSLQIYIPLKMIKTMVLF